MSIQTFLSRAREREEGGREEQNANTAPSETKECSPLELFLLVCSWSLFSFQPFWLNVFKQAVWGMRFLSKKVYNKKLDCAGTVSVGISGEVLPIT